MLQVDSTMKKSKVNPKNSSWAENWIPVRGIQNGEIIETNDISAIRTTNEAHYRIVVDNTEKIAEIISAQTEIKGKEEFNIIAEREQVPNIVKTLVENNIKVYEVNEEKLSLEDAFLKITEEGENK